MDSHQTWPIFVVKSGIEPAFPKIWIFLLYSSSDVIYVSEMLFCFLPSQTMVSIATSFMHKSFNVVIFFI